MAKSSRSGSNPTKAMNQNPRVTESFEMLPSTRSLLPPTFGEQPWLIQLHVAAKHIQTFINPFNGSNEKRSIDKMQRKLCLGCFGDWILLIDIFTKGMVLLDLTSDTEIKLPPFPKSFYDLGCFAISTCPKSPSCVIVMAGRFGAYLLYCQLKEQKWNETNQFDFCNIMVERCFNGDIAISQGKIYAFVYSWVAWNVMVIDLESLLTGVVECNLVPVPKCFHDAHDYINRIVVSGENVFFVMVRFSLGVVIDAEIHILDKSKSTRKKKYDDPWVTVESINRRVFFLGADYSTSFSVNLMGMLRNIIYVLRKECGGQRLHTICLDNQTTSSKLLHPGPTDKWDKLYWAVPSRSRSAVWGVTESSTVFLSKDGSTSNEEPEMRGDISAPWPDMPADLIDTVLQSLSLADRIRMASVCKSWNSTYNSMPESKCFPWLLHFPLDTSCCKLLDPFHRQEHSISMKWLRTDGRLRLHFSKHGWIMISDRSCSLFILNPLTREVIEVPPLRENELRNMSFSFSLVPTSLDCVVFGMFGSTIKAWCRGWVNWCESKVEGMSAKDEFRASFASPVVFRGKLYCLGMGGHLVVYDPEKNIAQLLKKPKRRHSRWEKGPGEKEFYLLEIDRELVIIFKGRKQTYVSVYKLNESKKAWVKLQCLGDKTVFLSCRGALSRPSEKKEYANGILFPRFDAEKNNGMAFYSMEDCVFPANFDDMKELMNCAWFEPNLTTMQKSVEEEEKLEGFVFYELPLGAF